MNQLTHRVELSILLTALELLLQNIQNSKHDGLDLDFSDILIRKLNIINAGNDCSDFSYGNYKLIDLSLKIVLIRQYQSEKKHIQW